MAATPLPDYRNIFIIGAQSTGKSTLVEALKGIYTNNTGPESPKVIIIEEVARKVLEDLGISGPDSINSTEDFLQLQAAVLKGQLGAESKAKRKNVAWYISDRSGLDPIVYARLFVGNEGAQMLLESMEWASLERNTKAGWVFLCEAGCTWLVDDGMRLMPKDLEEKEHVDQAFRSLLRERKIEYCIVPRSVTAMDERVALVTKCKGIGGLS